MADRRYTFQPCSCGDAFCAGCEQAEVPAEVLARQEADRRRRNAQARARRAALADAMDSIGMVRVRSASGRVYWE